MWSDSTLAEEGFIFSSKTKKVYNWDPGDSEIATEAFYRTIHGPNFELLPDKWNQLIVGIGDIYGTPAEIAQTNTLVFDHIRVKPRYIIL